MVPPATAEGAARKNFFLENELQYSSNNPWKNHRDIINRFRDISFDQLYCLLIHCALPPTPPVKKQFIELPTFQWELKNTGKYMLYMMFIVCINMVVYAYIFGNIQHPNIQKILPCCFLNYKKDYHSKLSYAYPLNLFI